MAFWDPQRIMDALIKMDYGVDRELAILTNIAEDEDSPATIRMTALKAIRSIAAESLEAHGLLTQVRQSREALSSGDSQTTLDVLTAETKRVLNITGRPTIHTVGLSTNNSPQETKQFSGKEEISPSESPVPPEVNTSNYISNSLETLHASPQPSRDCPHRTNESEQTSRDHQGEDLFGTGRDSNYHGGHQVSGSSRKGHGTTPGAPPRRGSSHSPAGSSSSRNSNDFGAGSTNTFTESTSMGGIPGVPPGTSTDGGPEISDDVPEIPGTSETPTDGAPNRHPNDASSFHGRQSPTKQIFGGGLCG